MYKYECPQSTIIYISYEAVSSTRELKNSRIYLLYISRWRRVLSNQVKLID